MTLDLAALKSKLREYDKSMPKCPKRIEVVRFVLPTFPDRPAIPATEQQPCCRPADHDGECRSTRPVLGWPGYEVLKELIEIAEKEVG